MGHLSQPQSLHQSLHPCSPCGRFAPPRPLRCRSSVVEHSLGKGEVDSSILSGSTSGDANGSAAFDDFRRKRSATENPAKSGNNPVTSANSDTLVTRGDAFRSVSCAVRCNLAPLWESRAAQIVSRVTRPCRRRLVGRDCSSAAAMASAAQPVLKDAISCAS
jgi:hypothetical protein